MGLIQNSKDKKDLNVELNLLPVFDVLSVCICFLLMTVVWVEVRSLETKQAFGDQDSTANAKSSSFWITIDEKNNLKMVIKNSDSRQSERVIPNRNGLIDLKYAKTAFAAAASQKVSSTHILPARSTKYDQVIQLMDLAKQAGIINIGLSPI